MILLQIISKEIYISYSSFSTMRSIKRYLRYLTDIFSPSVGEKIYKYKQSELWLLLILNVIIISIILSIEYTSAFNSLFNSINSTNFNKFSLQMNIIPKKNIKSNGITILRTIDSRDFEKLLNKWESEQIKNSLKPTKSNENNSNISGLDKNHSSGKNSLDKNSSASRLNESPNEYINESLIAEKYSQFINNSILNYLSKGILIYNNTLYYGSSFCFLDNWACRFTKFHRIPLNRDFLNLNSSRNFSLNNDFRRDTILSRTLNNTQDSLNNTKTRNQANNYKNNQINTKNQITGKNGTNINVSNNSKNNSVVTKDKESYSSFSRVAEMAQMTPKRIITTSFMIGLFIVFFILAFVVLFSYVILALLVSFLISFILLLVKHKSISIKTLFKINLFSTGILIIVFAVMWFFIFHSLLIPFLIYLSFVLLILYIESNNHQLRSEKHKRYIDPERHERTGNFRFNINKSKNSKIDSKNSHSKKEDIWS